MTPADFLDAARLYQRVIGFDDVAITGGGDGRPRRGALPARRRRPGPPDRGRRPRACPTTRRRTWRGATSPPAGSAPRTSAARSTPTARPTSGRRPTDKAEIATRLGWLSKELGDTGAAGKYFAKARGDAGLLVRDRRHRRHRRSSRSPCDLRRPPGAASLYALLRIDKVALADGRAVAAVDGDPRPRAAPPDAAPPAVQHVLAVARRAVRRAAVRPLAVPRASTCCSRPAASLASFAFRRRPTPCGRRVGRDLRPVRPAGRRRAASIGRSSTARAASFMGQLGGLVIINLLFGVRSCPASTTWPTSAAWSRASSLGLLFAPTRVPTLRSLWLRPGPTPGTPCRCSAAAATGRSASRGWRARGRVPRHVDARRRGLGARPCSRCSRALAAGVGGRGVDRDPRGRGRCRPLAPARLEAAIEELVAEVVGAQAAAGLDLVTDGQVRWPDPARPCCARSPPSDTGADGLLARTWRATAALSDRVSPRRSRGRLARGGASTTAWAPARSNRVQPRAGGPPGGRARALAAAGCPLVLIEEPAAIGIGYEADDEADAAERALFVSTQARLLAAAPGLHAMLVDHRRIGVAGRRRDDPRTRRISRYLFDLIDGPGQLVPRARRARRSRVVCGALRRESVADQAPELVWAARYAASANGRGPERVGLANGSPLVGLDPRRPGRRSTPSSGRRGWPRCRPSEAVAAGPRPAHLPQPRPTRRSGRAGREPEALAPPSPCRATRAKPGCSRRATVGPSSLRGHRDRPSASRAPPRVATPVPTGERRSSW